MHHCSALGSAPTPWNHDGSMRRRELSNALLNLMQKFLWIVLFMD